MKTLNLRIIAITICFLVLPQFVKAQFLENLGKRAQNAAEQAVTRKTAQKVNKETERAMDTIFEGGKGNKKKSKKTSESDTVTNEDVVQETISSSFGVYSTFTFVPGNKLLFYDDFATDGIGDFPANWETGGSGEVVITSESESKWLSLIRRSGYMPTLENKLPDNYTIEFDLTNNGYGSGKPNSKIYMAFLSKKAYAMGSGGSLADVEILLSNNGFNVRNVENFGGEVEVKIGNVIEREMTDYLNATVHISIAVNKKRLRMWVNEEKMVDSPNLLQANIGDYFIIEARDVLPEKGHFVGISNFRISESTEDMRSLLLKNGKFSTTGIYFETDTWSVKKESYGVLQEIAKMLQKEENLKLEIVGYTDSQGKEDYNQMLSENRAEKVKQILVEEFGISENRLKFKGKGETEPADDNNTEKGRANNRRVEFIMIK